MIFLQTLFSLLLAEKNRLKPGRSDVWLRELISLERKHRFIR